MIGSVVDERYRILRRLGSGGMAEVYLAEHVEHGRREALKILRSSLMNEEEFLHRFRREARAINRVQHPNIVSLYDFGRLPDGRFYLTMEYAEGESLSDLLKRGPLELAQALELTEQIADAVGHAHSRGVVHRDLKPENMILTHRRGRTMVKVLDFGIAKIIDRGYSESALVTGKGEIFGTPAYMAPEQVTGVGDDPRSDIYSIGCLCYEMLTGRPPFVGSKLDVIQAHTRDEPLRPSEYRAEIPAALDAVILRALTKDPERRYQDPLALIAALEEIEVSGRDRLRETDRIRKPKRTPSVGYPAQRLDWKLESGSFPALSDTNQPTAEEVERTYRTTLRQLAEALLDRGVIDPHMLIGVTNVLQMETRLATLDGESAGLEQRYSQLEQATRERQASLRFALGELRYESTRLAANGEVRPDLDHQIRELSARLSAVTAELEADADRVTERQVEIAAERADIEERLADTYGMLAPLVEAHLSAVERTSEIASLMDRLLIAREMRGS